jgi:hypothetical protein
MRARQTGNNGRGVLAAAVRAELAQPKSLSALCKLIAPGRALLATGY